MEQIPEQPLSGLPPAVDAPLVLAPLATRLMAWVIDCSFKCLIILMVAFASTFVFKLTPQVSTLLSLLVAILFEPVCLSTYGSTFGKAHFNLKVRKAEADERLTMWRAVARSVVKDGGFILASLTALLDSKRRAIYDKLVGSAVVLKDSPSSNN